MKGGDKSSMNSREGLSLMKSKGREININLYEAQIPKTIFLILTILAIASPNDIAKAGGFDIHGLPVKNP